jgi:hypothetical protein
MAKIDDATWAFVVARLEELKGQEKRLLTATDGLKLPPESPLIEPFYSLCDSLLLSLSFMIGDNFENLSWWAYECGFGEYPNEAGCKDDMRLIDSLDKLRWLIELDCKNG